MKKTTSTEWLPSLLIDAEKSSPWVQTVILRLILSKPLSPQLTEKQAECLDTLKFMHSLDSLWGQDHIESILQGLTDEELSDLLLRVEFASEPLNTTESKKSVTLSNLGDDC